jgi:hypothetical protein
MKNSTNNIRKIRRISDLALATIILGIGMMVLGTSMIAGCMLSMARGISLLGGASNLMLFALTHGTMFIADGILLIAFCIMVATRYPLSTAFSVLYYFSIFCVLLSSSVMVFGVLIGATFMGFIVSVSGLAISGMLAYLVNRLRVGTKKMVKSEAYHVAYHLKKAV